MVVWAALLGCRADNLNSDPFWHPVDRALAVDRGHSPTRTSPTFGPLSFEQQAFGLQGARTGGNSHGVGIAAVDLDGDDLPEVVLANGLLNNGGQGFDTTMWSNRDGVLVDVTDASNVRALLGGRDVYSVAAGDLDGDGDVDLYFGVQPTNVLLLNEGGLVFRDGTAEWNAAGPASDASLVGDGRSKVVVMGDTNGDGRLDLISASSTLPDPGVTLLVHDGSSLVDRTAGSGMAIHGSGNPCALMVTDTDNDGRADVWIWNDRGGHVLLRGIEGGFDNLGGSADGVNIRNPMGIDAADIDRDGDLDYAISNIGDHPLLVNLGDGRFRNETRERGTRGDYGWGLAFEDFDRDGWADLFVTQEDNRPWLSYHNDRTGHFTSASWEHPDVASNGAAHNVPAAFADLDGDGDTDVLGGFTDGSAPVAFANNTAGGHWLSVVVDDDGNGAAGGVGARVYVRTADGLQFQGISGGSSRASQNALSARFGLGDWDGAEEVVVQWADGRQWVATNVPGDQVLHVVQSAL